MTLLVAGPVTEDRIIKGKNEYSHVGGATYFQTFVFDNLDIDYKAAVNLSKIDLIKEFPINSNIIPLIKNDTHFFINHYPDENNLDIRFQYSNFADIEITKKDLTPIVESISNLEAIVLNPLNRYDFSIKTINYLKSLDCPIYLSLQGFLRYSGKDNKIEIQDNSQLIDILDGIEALFLDKSEANIVFGDNFSRFNINEIIVTEGSRGSNVITDSKLNHIPAIKNMNIVDSTGCGDTYMAGYISRRIKGKTVIDSANFASLIASIKLSYKGPFKGL